MFQRAQLATLQQRLLAPREHIQVMMGPRQVGKSTIAHQLTQILPLPIQSASGDAAYNANHTWIQQQWTTARYLVKEHGIGLLILDEVQKLKDWSSIVKQL